MKISYAIPVCNEHDELDRLLSILIKNKRSSDEIVVQADLGNTTEEVYKVIEKYKEDIKSLECPLKSDFASFKNHLKQNCSGNWIFQIDADEYISEEFIQNLHIILDENPQVEVFLLPRINTVNGITQDHIRKWNWRVNDKGWINFPDYQTRILKNTSKINWINKVHEILNGQTSYSIFPQEEVYCLIHEKTIDRQERQNSIYDSI